MLETYRENEKKGTNINRMREKNEQAACRYYPLDSIFNICFSEV